MCHIHATHLPCRHTYMRTVKNCYLFAHCKQKFFDAFIKAAHVELFMPGVRILSPGDPCRCVCETWLTRCCSSLGKQRLQKCHINTC